MKRTARDNRERYTNIAKPVEKVELNEKKPKARLIATICLGVVGAGFLSYAFVNFLNKDEGWTQVKANSTSGRNCSEDFVFNYDFSDGSNNKELQNEYTDACVKAYELFDAADESENYKNVAYINAHPNEEIKVDDVLYEAFEKINKSGDRSIYLGPIYSYYDNVFFCNDDSQLSDYDAHENAGLADEYAQVAKYASDSGSVDIKLLGDDTIELSVSEEYMKYVDENSLDSYVDFYWMKNAFITDYITETLMDAGFENGLLASSDGFVRAFSDIKQTASDDGSFVNDNGYVYKMYNGQGNTIYGVGSFAYENAMSIVTYKNYAINDNDSLYYYDTRDGRTLNRYLSLEDGQSRAALSEITFMSEDRSCVDLMLSTKGYYISDTFDENGVKNLKTDGIYSIYFKDNCAYYNYKDLEFGTLYDKNGIKFDVMFQKQD